MSWDNVYPDKVSNLEFLVFKNHVHQWLEEFMESRGPSDDNALYWICKCQKMLIYRFLFSQNVNVKVLVHL